MQTLLIISAAVISNAVYIISKHRTPAVDNLKVCTGANVSFNWTVDVVPGGRIIAVIWLFESPGKKNITVASLVNDQFYPRLDKSHVTFLPKAGLQISNVTSEHSGRYYVIAQFQSKGGHGVTSFQNGASLFVSDAEPVIRDGQLRVTLGYNGIKDNNRQTWTAGLYCGQFVSRGRSPVEATWTTPSGRTVNGDFDETTASFILPFAEDVESGTYVCHLKMSNATGCLVSTTTTAAQLQVDGRDVRVMILEMQNRELSDKYNRIMTQPISSQLNHVFLSHEKSNATDFYRLVAKKSEDALDEEQQLGRRQGNGVSLNIHNNIHLPDGTLQDFRKEVASKNAQQDREMNETASKMEDLEMELEEIIEKNMQENRKLEQILDWNAQQDREMNETASKTEELERELKEIIAINVQQNTQLGEILARIAQDDREMNETASKTEELEREQDEVIAKNVQQDRQLEQVVAKMESNTSRLDMLVQTQMRALEANAHNTSQQFLSLKAELDVIKKFINKTTATPICLPEWTFFNDHIYRYFNEAIAWKNAKARCEAEQSWLVESNSELENKFLLNLTNGRDKIWIGLSDAEVERTFVWAASNKSLAENVYTNWDKNQPDNYLNNEDCVHLRSSGKWNDVECSYKSEFVCESLVKWCKVLEGQLVEILARNAQQDREMNETASKTKELERELKEIITKNMQQNRQLEHILAKNAEHDRLMNETASKTKELEREQDAVIAKTVQQDRELEQVVAKMESNTSRLDMLVQTQMRALEANAHNTSQKFLSLKAELDDMKKLINKTTDTPICLREWTLFNGHVYKYIDEYVKWSNAKARCEAEKSWLVEINSDLENNILVNLTNGIDIWIGLSDTAIEGTFVWATSNESLAENVYTNWDIGQPDHNLNEDCVHLWKSRGKWNDLDCSKERRFVCERLADKQEESLGTDC